MDHVCTVNVVKAAQTLIEKALELWTGETLSLAGLIQEVLYVFVKEIEDEEYLVILCRHIFAVIDVKKLYCMLIVGHH